MEIYNYNEKKSYHDNGRGHEKDGKHVYPLGFLIYNDGLIVDGVHDVLGSVRYEVHPTKDGSRVFGRYHFAREGSAYRNQGIYEGNLDSYFIDKTRIEFVLNLNATTGA